jgi:hypothetical protein
MARQQHNNSASGTGKNKFLIVGAAVVVALAYFGFVRPAQLHVALLQHQCDQLTAAVTRLDRRGDAVGRGLHLIDLLDQQNSKIASAETALRELVDLRRRLADESEQIASAVGALDKLEEVRMQVDEQSRTLAEAAGALQQMDQVATSIATTRDVAQEAQGTLQELGQLQTHLVEDLARVSGTFPALKPVVEDIQQLCDRLTDSENQVRRATVVSQRLTALQDQLVDAVPTLPQAEQACRQMGSLCEKLEAQTTTVVVAQRQLDELSRWKSEVLAQTRDLSGAAAVLTQLWELRDGLLRSSGTLGEIQHLVVDMVLLEPAVQRAMLSLKPVVEMTRMSRQLETPQPETGPLENTTVDEQGKHESTPVETRTSAQIDSPQASSSQATWTEMFESAVAWCQQTLK